MGQKLMESSDPGVASTTQQLHWSILPEPLAEPTSHRVRCHICAHSYSSVFDGIETVQHGIVKRHMRCPNGHGFWVATDQKPIVLTPSGWRLVLPDPGETRPMWSPWDHPLLGTVHYALNHLPLPYRARPNQQALADSVALALTHHGVLWAQAGVGLGKTLAYLIPLVCAWDQHPTQPIIISTATIALQRQLAQDLQTVQSMLHRNIPVLMVQGATQYWCWQRTQDSSLRLPPRWDTLRHQLSPFSIARQMQRDQLPPLPEAQWQQVHVMAPDCLSCVHRTHCGFPALRRETQQATGILLINHGILADEIVRQQQGRELRWRTPQAIVVDEAHSLTATLRNITRQTIAHSTVFEYLASLREVARRLTFQDSAWTTRAAHVDRFVTALQQDLTRFRAITQRHGDPTREWGWARTTSTDRAWTLLCTDRLVFETATRGHRGLWTDPLSFWEWGEALMAWARHERQAAWAFTLTDDAWIRYALDLSESWTRLTAEPTLMVSGTLSPPGAESRYGPGAAAVSPSRQYRFDAPSPFRYADQLRYQWVPGFPSPHDRWIERATAVVRWVTAVYQPENPLGTRIVVLVTNKQLGSQIVPLLRRQGLPGCDDLHPPDLTDDTQPWIYVSTAAWEGWDCPGPKTVVIPQLPNPVPTDPAFQMFQHDYASERADSNAIRRAWMHQRAQQGVGRAIRTATDRSVVYWLDPRLPTYQPALADALPRAPWTLGHTVDYWMPWDLAPHKTVSR